MPNFKLLEIRAGNFMTLFSLLYEYCLSELRTEFGSTNLEIPLTSESYSGM